MLLPIYLYGQPVLKKRADEIDESYPNLNELIENMWDTMYNAQGVGLAAPQIGRSIRLFLVDTEQVLKDEDGEEGIKKAFINAQILDEEGEEWDYEEGCLSIPNIRGDVSRKPVIRIRYMDEEFKEHTELFEGINARVIQHDYDHIEGVLFTENLKPVRKRLVSRKLDQIRKGKVKADYHVKPLAG
jgi:peptide deformylase